MWWLWCDSHEQRCQVCWRKIAALPNPTALAIHSIEASLDSSIASAASTRWLVTQACGVAPVSARKRRANVRAVELRPGSKRIVHHANIVVDRGRMLRSQNGRDGQPGFPGMDVITQSVGEFGPRHEWAGYAAAVGTHPVPTATVDRRPGAAHALPCTSMPRTGRDVLLEVLRSEDVRHLARSRVSPGHVRCVSHVFPHGRASSLCER